MSVLAADETRAVRMLAQGVDAEEVAAVCPGVDLADPRLVDLVAWHRSTAEAAEKLTPEYLRVRLMSAVEEQVEVDEPDPADAVAAETEKRPVKMVKVKRPALDAKERARLLTQIAKMK